uniref:DegT/DnrJ/EryC1/StrS family aminotransferase n=1 Tax=Flavobacterium sp. TaxID=239 RepID=UPI0035B1D86B
NNRRREIANRYQKELAGLGFVLPTVPDGTEPVWHLYVICCDDRDGLQARLNEVGITTLIHYPIPPHMQQAYADMGMKSGDYPIAEKMAREVLSIPIGPQMDNAQIDAVIANIRQ